MAGGAQGRGVEDLGCVVGVRMRGGREKKHEKLKRSSLFCRVVRELSSDIFGDSVFSALYFHFFP